MLYKAAVACSNFAAVSFTFKIMPICLLPWLFFNFLLESVLPWWCTVKKEIWCYFLRMVFLANCPWNASMIICGKTWYSFSHWMPQVVTVKNHSMGFFLTLYQAWLLVNWMFDNQIPVLISAQEQKEESKVLLIGQKFLLKEVLCLWFNGIGRLEEAFLILMDLPG